MAVPSFSWSTLGLWLNRHRDNGSGKDIDSRTTGFDRVAQGLTGCGVLQAHDSNDVAGAYRVNFFTLICVHSVNLCRSALCGP